MNILFANYGNSRTNSMNHIVGFANGLVDLGHTCHVATPLPDDGGEHRLQGSARLVSFEEACRSSALYPNGSRADILHLWTPREVTRHFAIRYGSEHPVKVVLHLEDNEEEIAASYYRVPYKELRQNGLPEGFSHWEPMLSRPFFYEAFCELADGTTGITERLQAFASGQAPFLTLLPGLRPEAFAGAAPEEGFRRRYGVSADERIVVYPGSVTSSNREEIAHLYAAVRLLNQRGLPTRLIKTGPGDPGLASLCAFPLSDYIIDLGIVAMDRIPGLLALADVLIQPGSPSAYNDFRLPSKLPEFLASGKPVVTPNTNIARDFVSGRDCLKLETGTPEEIANCCAAIFDSADLGSKLSTSGRALARQLFDQDARARELVDFYKSLSHSSESIWQSAATMAEVAFRRLRLCAVENMGPPERLLCFLQHALGEQQRAADRSLADGRALTDRNVQQAAELTQLSERIEDLKKQVRHRNDSVQHLKSTFSWRCTQPLRALRRLVLDSRKGSISGESLKDANPEESTEFTPPKVKVTSTEPILPNAYRDYNDFVARLQPLVDAYIHSFRKRLGRLENAPLISVILPVYNVDPQWLDEAIQSVLDQIYPHWELCLADDASPRPEVRECLGRWEKADTRIKIDLRSENGHISRASNSALALAEGEFVALLDHDDRLASHALARIADALAAHPDANLVFTDEDKIDQSGYRSQPTFKSGFNPDLLTAQNCISHLGVYRRALVEELGGFRAGMEGAQDWDLALRVAEKSRPDQIVHIPEVLYHWRSISGSTASDIGEKSYAHEAGRKAVEAHLARTGQDAAVEPVERFYWRARYRLPQFPPRASIVIPTRDRLELLRPCIESIQSLTTYPTFEIVVVDNDSSEAETRSYLENALAPGLRVVPFDGPFNFAAICNLAVSHCDSEVICLLNNDIQIESGEWLEEMVSHVCRPEIGAVGARLLYPHGHVQHAGIVMGIGGVASEAFKGIHCEDDGYIHRAHLVGNYSAVTGACLAVRKAVWQRVDGMDAKNTPNAYSDVDFCLRVSEAGWRNLYTPFATLRHRESASRGPETATDRVAAFEQASAYMHRRWASVIADDPFYNPNLTLEREDFTLSRHPRGYRTN